jgi:hypothetical protein
MVNLRKRAILIAVILAACAVISAAQGFRNAIRPDGSQDNQWGPSRFLLEHNNPYALFLGYALNNKSGSSPFILNQGPSYPVNGLILMWPYAVLNWEIAKWLWAVSNFLFTFVIVFMLYNLYLPHKPWYFLGIVGALFLTCTPHRNLIGNGQHALFCLAFFTISLAKYKDNKLISGFCLAVALSQKMREA